MHHLRLLALLSTVLLCAPPSAEGSPRPTRQRLRHAKKILADIRLVDGSGSGLDADTVQGLTPPMVRDANGKFVGALIELTDDLNGAGYIIRRVGDQPLRFHVSAGGFDSFGLELFFESGDCTGQPFLRFPEPQPRMLPDDAFVSGQLAYYPIGDPTQRPLASKLDVNETEADCVSSLHGTFVPPDRCCQPYGAPLAVVAAQSFDLGTLGLTPPFRLDVLPLPAQASTTTTTLP